MDYHIAFDPELGLSSQEFTSAWNETPECRALAEAQLSDQPPQDFPLDPQMVQQGLILLAGAGGKMALDVLKKVVTEKLADYLEQKLSRKPAIKVESIRQPGGAYLLVVTEGEE